MAKDEIVIVSTDTGSKASEPSLPRFQSREWYAAVAAEIKSRPVVGRKKRSPLTTDEINEIARLYSERMRGGK